MGVGEQVLASGGSGCDPGPLRVTGLAPLLRGPAPPLGLGTRHHSRACPNVTGDLRAGGSKQAPWPFLLPRLGCPRSPPRPHWQHPRGAHCRGGQVGAGRGKASLTRAGVCHPARGQQAWGPREPEEGVGFGPASRPWGPRLPAGTWAPWPRRAGDRALVVSASLAARGEGVCAPLI